MTGPANLVFYLIAALTVGSAILVAILPNIVYSAVALLFSFAGVAGLYVFLSADFLAATQALAFVGGVLYGGLGDPQLREHHPRPAAPVCGPPKRRRRRPSFAASSHAGRGRRRA